VKAVLRLIIGVLARTDPGLWYLLDLRRRSVLSWAPVVLFLAILAFTEAESLIAGNVAAAAIFALLAFLFGVKVACLSVRMRSFAGTSAVRSPIEYPQATNYPRPLRALVACCYGVAT
jgi:hypothetical protein